MKKMILPEKRIMGKIDASARTTGIFPRRINGEKYIGNVTTLQESELKIIAAPLLSDLTSKARGIWGRAVFLCLYLHQRLLLFLSRLCSVFFIPVSHHTHHGNKVQTGNLDVQVPLEQDDEIGYLLQAPSTP